MWNLKKIHRRIIYVLEENSVENAISSRFEISSQNEFPKRLAEDNCALEKICWEGLNTSTAIIVFNPAMLKAQLSGEDGITYDLTIRVYDSETVNNVCGLIENHYAKELEKIFKEWYETQLEFEAGVQKYASSKLKYKNFTKETFVRSVLNNCPSESIREKIMYLFHCANNLCKEENCIQNQLSALKSNSAELHDAGYVCIAVCQRGWNYTDEPQEIVHDIPLLDKEFNYLKPILIKLASTLPELEPPFRGKDYYVDSFKNLSFERDVDTLN